MCDVSKGRLLKCRDAVGGIAALYFVPNGTLGAITYDADGKAITAFAVGASAYKYEVHLGNSLTQNINSSEENGTTFIEQSLAVTLQGMSQEDNAELSVLIKGRPHVLVEDNLGNFHLMGLVKGAATVSGTALTGDSMGDLNGYTLGMVSREKEFANYYLGDIDAEFTVVTGT